jgi:archaellum component FlaC
MLGIAPLEDKINDQKRRADKQIKKIENTNEELQELKQEREEIEKEYKKIRREIIALLAATLIKTCIGDLTQKTEVSKSQDNVEIAIPKEAKY